MLQARATNTILRHCIPRTPATKETLSWRQGSEESACFLLLYFCDD